MKIHEGCFVRLRKDYPNRWLVEGIVLRINWNDKAEIRWHGPTPKILMHNLSDLECVDHSKEKLESIYRYIPHLQNMVLKREEGIWYIGKPLAAPELKLWARVKNAWLVLIGKVFVTRWH